MTPKLTKREKELNDIIKNISYIKTPTKQEYTKAAKNGEDVNDYTEEKLQTFPVKHPVTDETIQIYNHDISIIDIPEINKQDYIASATQEFFGIKIYNKLLHQISDERYTDDVYYKTKKPDYDTFIQYCLLLNDMKRYISIACPNFDKHQSAYKQQFRQLAQQLPHNKFFVTMATYFDDYNLNQIRKAQEHALLALQLQNITQKIAKKIIEIINLQLQK